MSNDWLEGLTNQLSTLGMDRSVALWQQAFDLACSRLGISRRPREIRRHSKALMHWRRFYFAALALGALKGAE